MSVYSDMAKLSSDIAKDICENEKVEKFVSGTVPTVVGKIVEVTTDSKTLGAAANATMSGVSKAYGKEVAEATTSVGVTVAIGAASIVAAGAVVVAAPILIAGAILESIFGD